MGRKSREKARRRQDPRYAARVKAAKAERRGRRVAPSAEAFEALAAGGSRQVVEAIIARHNTRWENVLQSSRAMSDKAAETLHVAFPIDVALWRLGVRFTEPPPSYFGEWPEHLRWGVDSACQTERLAMACNVVGASAVARTQFERWSANRTTSNDLQPEEGTSTSAHYSYIWRFERPEQDTGQIWSELSELLHGRGPLVAAARWDAVELADPSGLPAANGSFDRVQMATQLALRQVLLCVADLMHEPLFPRGLKQQLVRLPMSLPAEVTAANATPMLWPLTLDVLTDWGRRIEQVGLPYLDDVKALAGGGSPRPRSYAERALDALMSRRSRAVTIARFAFESEKEQLGDAFDSESVARREFAYLLINETAGLLAKWSGEPKVSDALVVASCALRSAFWLWLEDDERSMMLTRTVLEQTARLRAWRLKPSGAAKFEARGERTSGRDWLELAGWRRLSVLNRALGEFAHASPESARWSGAREALADLQEPDPESLSAPLHTARGAGLNQVAFAFGAELVARLQQDYPRLADALRDHLPYGDDDGASDEIERWLGRCWSHRGRSFGDPDFAR